MLELRQAAGMTLCVSHKAAHQIQREQYRSALAIDWRSSNRQRQFPLTARISVGAFPDAGSIESSWSSRLGLAQRQAQMDNIGGSP
jgi:hypothetical protein